MLASMATAHQSAVKFRPESHAPAGVMVDHLHKQGEWMLGLRAVSQQKGDQLYQGSARIEPTQAAQAGYTMYSTEMDMQMWMLDVMYAVTDNVTLMLMPQYMSMDMRMAMTPTMMDMEDDMAMDGMHHMAHDHDVAGLGDMQVGALFRLGQWGTHQLHGAMLISVPTGDAELKDAEGKYVSYGMQLGSGTWDAIPSITYTGYDAQLSWGAQLGTVQRLEDENDAGFSFGERYFATAWSGYRLLPWISASLRLAYDKSLDVKGHYNGPHNHSSPTHLQRNYGGELWLAGAGVNLVAQSGILGGIRVGVEWLTPIDEHYKGIQSSVDDVLNVSVSYAF